MDKEILLYPIRIIKVNLEASREYYFLKIKINIYMYIIYIYSLGGAFLVILYLLIITD